MVPGYGTSRQGAQPAVDASMVDEKKAVDVLPVDDDRVKAFVKPLTWYKRLSAREVSLCIGYHLTPCCVRKGAIQTLFVFCLS